MSDITAQLTTMIKTGLASKDFSTGSKGFFVSDKIMTEGGTRYQAQAQAILVGSKGDPKIKVKATTDEVRDIMVGMIPAEPAEREFSTGRTGYRVQGKAEAHDQRFQISVQAVRLPN